MHLALDLMHKRTKTDLITGLKTRTKAGRPDWDDLFQAIKKQDMGKVIKVILQHVRCQLEISFYEEPYVAIISNLTSTSRNLQVTVFYCGNPGLADVLLEKANKFDFSFKKEIF